MEKDKEQQRLQFNSAAENDDERRRPECSNGKISGEEIENLDPGSFVATYSKLEKYSKTSCLSRNILKIKQRKPRATTF